MPRHACLGCARALGSMSGVWGGEGDGIVVCCQSTYVTVTRIQRILHSIQRVRMWLLCMIIFFNVINSTLTHYWNYNVLPSQRMININTCLNERINDYLREICAQRILVSTLYTSTWHYCYHVKTFNACFNLWRYIRSTCVVFNV